MTDGSLRASAAVQVRGTIAPQGTAVTSGLNDVRAQETDAAEVTLAYGTASGQADIICAHDRTLNATTAETIDLYTGSTLKDLFGATAAFRKIKFLSVSIKSGGDTAGLAIGGAAADQWIAFFANVSDIHKIFPSGPAYQGGSPAGVAVGTTTKNLKIENLGSVAVTYRIVVAGTSA